MANLIIQQESDTKNPLAFFEYFFKSGGYQKKLNDFHSHPEVVYDLVVSVSKKEDYIEYYHNNCEGIDYPRRDYFITDVEKQLKYQSLVSCNLIDTNIDQKIQNGESIIPYLQRQFDRLLILRHTINISPILSKYKESGNSIDQLILNLATSYKTFLRQLNSPDISSVIEAIKLQNKKNVSIPAQSTPSESEKKFAENKNPKLSYFKWTANPDENIFKLHNVLTENEAIYGDTETLDELAIAFSGKPLTKSLKIKWRIKGHVGSTKAPLIKVIHLLMNELKLIEYISEPTIFARTIENIFIDDQGSYLENVIQSMSDNSKKANLKERPILNAIRLTFSPAISTKNHANP